MARAAIDLSIFATIDFRFVSEDLSSKESILERPQKTRFIARIYFGA